MGYLFLSAALFFGLIKAYCGKKASNKISLFSDAVAITAVRMMLCFIIGVIIVLAKKQLPSSINTTAIIWVTLISGSSTALFTVSWLLSVRSVLFMTVEVFVMCGTIVPIFLSGALYKEPFTITQLCGIIFLIISVYLMCTQQKKISIDTGKKSIPLLIICGFSSGMADFSQKLFIKCAPDASITLFNLYTYLFAFILLLIIWIAIKLKFKENFELSSSVASVKPTFGYICVMSITLFLNAYFKTRAAGHLDAILLYPLSQGTSVVLSLAMSAILFKEKLTLRGLIGLIVALASLLLINLF